MFDHVGLRVKNVAKSARFYQAALAPLGFVLASQDESSAGLGPKGAPALWLTRDPKGGGVHLAFTARTREAVDAFHREGLERGGKDNGAPGPRPDYGPRYYAAFLVDLDGNNVEAVCNE